VRTAERQPAVADAGGCDHVRGEAGAIGDSQIA
jgi:hypothetical protein